MAGTAAGGTQAGPSAITPGRRRAAGIYGAIITAAVLAAGGNQLPTRALAVSVLVTLLVYWVAEEYAELLGEQVTGRLPTWAYVRTALATTWPMVSASYMPLLALVLARLAGATAPAAANIGLAAAIVLLTFVGWSAGRASRLRGWRLAVTTSIAAALGLVMVALKELVILHLH